LITFFHFDQVHYKGDSTTGVSTSILFMFLERFGFAWTHITSVIKGLLFHLGARLGKAYHSTTYLSLYLPSSDK